MERWLVMAVKVGHSSIARRPYSKGLSAAEKTERRAAGKAKAQAALERLDAGVNRIIESNDAFREYLRISSRLHNYSFGNRILIWLQRPDAGMVAGFQAWKKLDRPVMKGSKGIQILAPMTAKVEDKDTGEVEPRVIGYRVAYTFSVHDTDGPHFDIPEPMPLTDDGDEARDVLAVFIAKAEQLGIPVSFVAPDKDSLLASNGASGYYHPAENRIVVRADMPAAGRAQVLAHELAHAVAGRMGKRDAETVAEGASFVACAFHGLDTSQAALPYVAGWAADPARVRSLLGSIMDVANELTQGGDRCGVCGSTYDEYAAGGGCEACR